VVEICELDTALANLRPKGTFPEVSVWNFGSCQMQPLSMQSALTRTDASSKGDAKGYVLQFFHNSKSEIFWPRRILLIHSTRPSKHHPPAYLRDRWPF
jgi:hypothetical protein